MLLVGSRLSGCPVMSLQTGTKVASAQQPIIDPSNLHIAAYILEGPLLSENPTFLRTKDIREYGRLGMIIDSSDELVGLEDVIQLQKLYESHFALVGLDVVDDRGKKLGKIEDYTLETDQFIIQQLQVKRGFFKSFNDTGLLVHRSQIVEINNTAVIVKSPTVKSIEPVMQSVRSEFVNPFRKPSQPETESTEIH